MQDLFRFWDIVPDSTAGTSVTSHPHSITNAEKGRLTNSNDIEAGLVITQYRVLEPNSDCAVRRYLDWGPEKQFQLNFERAITSVFEEYLEEANRGPEIASEALKGIRSTMYSIQSAEPSTAQLTVAAFLGFDEGIVVYLDREETRRRLALTFDRTGILVSIASFYPDGSKKSMKGDGEWLATAKGLILDILEIEHVSAPHRA